MNSNKYDFKISTNTHTFLRKIVVSIFAVLSTVLFFYLNKVQPNYYIDEIFHIPQTLRFCDGNFTEWDEKITTFPGLYLIATSILAPFNLCSIIFLRGINLLGTFLNFYVIFELLKFTNYNDENGDAEKNKKRDNKGGRNISDERKQWIRLITSLNIALLPPLYFLLFLYYTDVVSTNMVLSMYLFHLKGKFKTSAFIGVLAVLLRQTNIVWVAWVAIERGIDIIENKNRKRMGKSLKNRASYVKLLWANLKEELSTNYIKSIKFIIETFLSLLPFILIGLSFISFVILNKGIVLGDRSAHVATIHFPQIFYYSIFVSLFCWPYFIPYIKDYLNLIKNRSILVLILFVLMAIIVHLNTLVHPYLLADNRHYTFYVWNRIMARYHMAKYVFIPVYGFSLYSLYRGIDHLRFTTIISYFLTVFIVLIPQLLLEPRYFFIPYILFRMNLKNNKFSQIILEGFTIISINIFQFFVFSNKVFYWQDDVNPQRISW